MINTVIDLSKHNTVTSFQAIYNAGIRGIIHKATQGLNSVDPQYSPRVKPIRSTGFMHGAYHFGTGADGAAQAKHFLDVVQPDERTLLVLDWEPNPNGPTMTLAQAAAFILKIEAETGRFPVLYSGHLAKDEFGKSLMFKPFGACPLWLAQYGPKAEVQPTWKTWTLWQYTDKGTVPGVAGNVDRNKFNGDGDALRKLWGYPPLP